MLLLVGSTTAGCGTWGSGRAAETRTADQPRTSTTTQPPKRPDNACDAIETLYAKMRVQAARWTPYQQPFDPAVAASAGRLANDLGNQLQHATDPKVRAQLATNVSALNRLGRAMRAGKQPDAVLTAARHTRVTYAALDAACHPNRTPARAEQAGATQPTTRSQQSTGTPPTSRAHRTATCRRVQHVIDKLAEASAAWSPERRPFDTTTASKFRVLGATLADLAPRAENAHIRTAIIENSATITGMSDAMHTRRRAGVDASLARAQLAYSHIEATCALR